MYQKGRLHMQNVMAGNCVCVGGRLGELYITLSSESRVLGGVLCVCEIWHWSYGVLVHFPVGSRKT